MNIASDSFEIYPAANRAPGCDYKARLNIEENLIKANNNITNNNNYVVNGLKIKVTNITQNNSTFTISPGECVINGYNIKIKDSISLSNNQNINCFIYFNLASQTKVVQSGNTDIDITEVVAFDQSDSMSDTFIGDGITTTFTLNNVGVIIDSVDITNNGTLVDSRTYSIYYNVSGVARVVFNSAPALNDVIVISYNISTSSNGIQAFVTSIENTNKWYLKLASLTYSDGNWTIDYGTRESRIVAQKIQISMNTTSGLIDNDKTTYLTDFLINDLVIDDGDIN